MGYGLTTILLSNKVWFDIPTVGTLTSHFLVAQSYLQLTEGILVSFFNHWLPLVVTSLVGDHEEFEAYFEVHNHYRWRTASEL